MGKHCRLFEFSKSPEFRVTARAVRDRYATSDLLAQTKAKRRRERIWDRCPEPTELDTLLEEIREREKSAEDKSKVLRNEKKAKDEKEKAAAEEIRQAALQTMAKRKSDDTGEKPKKAKLRRSTSDAIEFFCREVREGERIEERRVSHQKERA